MELSCRWIWKIYPHYQLLRNISFQTLTYHVFLSIILWEIDIALLYMHGLEITMIFLETMFVITLYVNGVVWWRMPPVSSFIVLNILVKDRFSIIQLGSFNPKPSIWFFLEAKTGILKQIWSCSGLSTDVSMPWNVFDKLFDYFVETNFKTNSENMYM